MVVFMWLEILQFIFIFVFSIYQFSMVRGWVNIYLMDQLNEMIIEEVLKREMLVGGVRIDGSFFIVSDCKKEF